MKKKKLIIFIPMIISLVVACYVTFVVVEHKILYHYFVVEKGKVYRSGTLSPLGLKWAKNKSGFKTIINVRSVKENALLWHQQELDFANKNNVKLIDIPIQPDSLPEKKKIQEFLKVMKNKDNYPVLIHCNQGVIRTSMMVYIYKVAIKGEQNKEAFRQLKFFGHSIDKSERTFIKDFLLQFDKKQFE